jgi:putative ABC transport system permease protein
MVPLRYNVRSLFVRKVTTFATAGGIALVVFVFAAGQMLGAGIGRAMEASGRDDTVIVLRKGSDSELSSGITNDYKKLGDRPEVAAVAGATAIGEIVIVITAELTSGAGASNVLVRGMPQEGFQFRPDAKIVAGRAPKPGTNEVVVGQAIAGRFRGLRIGESFELRRNRPLLVVGELAAGGSSYESEVWGDLDVIRRALGRESVVSSVRVRLTDPARFDAYKLAVEADKTFSVKAMRERDYFEKQGESIAGFLTGLAVAISVLFALAAMIGAAITMNGAIASRTREIGTLRALGFSRISILLAFIAEAIFLALIGGLVGTALVMSLTLATFRVLNFQTFSDIVITFTATPAVVMNALVFSAFMGLLGGLVPAIRAARVSPIEAMRG